MGCFSFLCKKCGKAVLSNSFSGQPVTLYLLRNGQLIQEMTGEYDSYGRVFTQDRSASHTWNNPTPDIPPSEHDQYFIDMGSDIWIWHRVADLMFDTDKANGIAAIHVACKCDGLVPTTRSEDDPNQGWGDDLELLGDTDPDTEYDQ